MAIRIKNLDLNTDGMKRHQMSGNIAATTSGVFNSIIFVAPIDCNLDYCDFYGGAFSANTSATLKIVVYRTGASGSTTGIFQTFSVATSAASHNYSANAKIRVIPTGAQLSAGTLVSVEISSLSAAIISNTFCLSTYTPLVHRNGR